MSGNGSTGGSRGVLRALYDWIKGTPTLPPPSPASASASEAGPAVPPKLGRYDIVRKLGEGGMGVVYAARDTQLERTVAVKTMSSMVQGDNARKRFWREARAAASVNHPNICQIYEIGEDAGLLFIAMELLEGEPLSDRLPRGALTVSEMLPIGLEMLAALSALHERGIVHRDLKPSNVFLTPHGVKLLDFGLARPDLETSLASRAGLTQPGIVMGTPRYMAPEQVTGEPVDSRSDLFATGAILFEVLSGRPAFSGNGIIEILHATVHEQPPALTGSPAVAAADRVIRRALSKRPAERPRSAQEMADELRGIRGVVGDDTPALAQALTRLVVLPFRVLRPDSESDFLAFSLPDAIATSLSGINSLVVRSSATAARFASDTPDLKALAVEADVDRVVMGSLVRAGDQIRATTQLVEAPGGTLLTSHTVQVSLGDLFHLQDDITRRIVEALSLPLGAGVASPSPDAPHNAQAYELYLRANELARNYGGVIEARDLYQRALELDPAFALAWAQLGRCHRVIGKFVAVSADSEAQAENAFQRALALNPRLSIAHKFYAYLEADMGQAQRAIVRLLNQASRRGNDPELFAGLVQACRYCGLYDESLAAHAEARRLDPNVSTSLEQTLLLAGDIEQLLAVEPPPVASGDQGIRIIGLGLAGRRDEARRLLEQMKELTDVPIFQSWVSHLRAWLDGSFEGVLVNFGAFDGLRIQQDPEAIFQEGWMFCDIGQHERGLEFLERAVAKGYSVAPTLIQRPQFDALRNDHRFRALVKQAEAGRDEALAAFRAAGGDRLLGR